MTITIVKTKPFVLLKNSFSHIKNSNLELDDFVMFHGYETLVHLDPNLVSTQRIDPIPGLSYLFEVIWSREDIFLPYYNYRKGKTTTLLVFSFCIYFMDRISLVQLTTTTIPLYWNYFWYFLLTIVYFLFDMVQLKLRR